MCTRRQMIQLGAIGTEGYCDDAPDAVASMRKFEETETGHLE